MPLLAGPALPERIEAVRRFNRFYTRRIGVLQEGVLHSAFTLTETRLLWELAHLPPDSRGVTVTGLASVLQLDTGYLSRLLRGFKERGFIKSTRSADDGRQLMLTLTAAGKRAFAPLNTRSQEAVDEVGREACWIAERDGVNVGCVCLVQARDDTTQQVVPGVAQLRLLLVEPAARGRGLGQRLVAECTRFAREAGYQRIRLWTNSVLTAARAIYEREGYRLTASEPHHSFGHDLVGETWERSLAGPSA
jgi:DNA-binding MarR family transcriptional regulator